MIRRWTSIGLVTGALFAVSHVGCSKRVEDPAIAEEVARREAFARKLLTTADGGNAPALRVTSSSDVHFEEGFSTIVFDPPDNAFNHAFRWMGKRGHVRLRPKPGRAMHLRVGGWMNEKFLHERGHMTAYIDGQSILPLPVPTDEKGIYVVDTIVEPGVFHGREWVDLEVVPSSVAFHWSDPPELKMIVVFDFVWKPAD
jgi:hypothetical protein